MADIKKERDELFVIVEKQEELLKEMDHFKNVANKVAAGEYITLEEHERVIEAIKESLKVNQEVIDELSRLKEGGLTGKVLLYKKLSLAIGEVRRIEKNGFNKHFEYYYATEGDILDGIRPILAEVGLAIWTDVLEESKTITEYFKSGYSKGKKTITKVKVKYTIFCTDSGESLDSHYYGEGEDEGDKGLYKAYTGATKYFLTKNFLISSGNILEPEKPMDPEADTHLDKGNNNPPPNNTPRNDKNGPNNGEIKKIESIQGKQEKEQIRELWASLEWPTDKFGDWYTKQAGKGANHKAMYEYLKGKLAEKAAETFSEGQAAGEEDPGAGQQNEPPPLTEPEEQQEEEDRYHWNGKKISELTPEEYIAYCEKYLPFDLTDQERDNILSGKAVRNVIA